MQTLVKEYQVTQLGLSQEGKQLVDLLAQLFTERDSAYERYMAPAQKAYQRAGVALLASGWGAAGASVYCGIQFGVIVGASLFGCTFLLTLWWFKKFHYWYCEKCASIVAASDDTVRPTINRCLDTHPELIQSLRSITDDRQCQTVAQKMEALLNRS